MSWSDHMRQPATAWWDRPSLVGDPHWSRRHDLVFASLIGGVLLLIMLIAGPLLGVLLGGGAAAGGVVHAAQGRRRLGRKLARGAMPRARSRGPHCPKACRTSREPIGARDGDCGCPCGGFMHGREAA